MDPPFDERRPRPLPILILLVGLGQLLRDLQVRLMAVLHLLHRLLDDVLLVPVDLLAGHFARFDQPVDGQGDDPRAAAPPGGEQLGRPPGGRVRLRGAHEPGRPQGRHGHRVRPVDMVGPLVARDVESFELFGGGARLVGREHVHMLRFGHDPHDLRAPVGHPPGEHPVGLMAADGRAARVVENLLDDLPVRVEHAVRRGRGIIVDGHGVDEVGGFRPEAATATGGEEFHPDDGEPVVFAGVRVLLGQADPVGRVECGGGEERFGGRDGEDFHAPVEVLREPASADGDGGDESGQSVHDGQERAGGFHQVVGASRVPDRRLGGQFREQPAGPVDGAEQSAALIVRECACSLYSNHTPRLCRVVD